MAALYRGDGLRVKSVARVLSRGEIDRFSEWLEAQGLLAAAR